MKLNITREKVTKKTEKEAEKDDIRTKDESIKLLEKDVERLKEQNIALAAQVVKMANYQKISAKENLEMIEITKNFDRFIKEVGNRFAEFGEYFENNNTATESLDYDKIAMIVHKYDLAKNRNKVQKVQKKGSKK